MPSEKDHAESLFSVLRYRDFRLFWIGNLISSSGVWMQNLAQGWLILKLSNSPFLLGLSGFASLIPTLGLALVGGTAADRMNRRTILFVSQSALMALAFILGVLTALGVIRPWHIILVVFLGGIALAMSSPAYQALIPDFVPKERLSQAIALNSVQFNLARIFGHSIAGLAVASLGEAGCFYINSLSYLALLFALLKILVPSGHIAHDKTPFGTRLREGIRHVVHQPVSIYLILTVGCTSFFGLPYFFLLPNFARDVLGKGVVKLGYLTASVSVGALLAALLMPALTRSIGKRRVVLGCSILFWLVLTLFSLSRIYGLSLFLLLSLGFVLVLTVTSVNNLLQVRTAAEMRGRVMSINAMALNGLAPVGSLVAGTLAQFVSAPIAVGAMAGSGLVATIVLVMKYGSEVSRSLDE